MPEAFRLCDPVLVVELTGLDFAVFAERLDEMGAAARNGGEADVDAVLLPGLLGVAVWQVNRTWSRSKVVKFVQQIGIDEVEMHAGESDDTGDGEARPPDESSSTSSPTSKQPPEESS